MNSWGRGSQACFIDDYSHCPNSSHQQVNRGCKTSIPLIRSSSVVSRNLPIAQMVVVKSLSRVRLFCDPMNCGPPGSLSLEFQARVGYHFLLQGIFLTQGSNPGLMHCGQSPVLQVDSLLTVTINLVFPFSQTETCPEIGILFESWNILGGLAKQ